MSLIWKAEWGTIPKPGSDTGDLAFTYLPNAQHIWSNVTHVDFNYLEKYDDGLFSVCTSLSITGLPIQKSSALAAQSAMAELMGETDFVTVYVSPSFGMVNDYNSMKNQLPSLGIQCPNLTEAFVSKISNRGSTYCKIASLNRVIFFSDFHSRGGYLFMFDLKTGNKITSGSDLWLISHNYLYFPVCIGYDGTQESLMEAENYCKVLMAQGGYSDSWYQFLLEGSSLSGGFFQDLFTNYSPPDYTPGEPENPYEPGGISGEGDNPPGTFDKTSDPIPDSPLPTLSMADTGFTRIYNPTLAQVQSLAQYLWKTEDIFETLWNHIKQSFENPMDVMIAFNIVPVAVPNGGTANFSIMYIDTGVQLTKAANQFVDVDCGTLTLQGYYGSALDYSPYTKIQCYLPFIGMVNLDPDEVMNTTLQIKYRVDIVSGGCVAKILVDGNCLYQYSGHCSISVPFSAADFSSYMNAMLRVASLAVGAAGAAIGGAVGAAAAVGAGEAAQQTSRIVNRTTITNTQRNPDTGRQIITGTQQIIQEQPVNENQSGTQASFAGLTPANVSNTVGAVMSSKAGILHAGSFNGNTGYLGVRYPYLIITTPRQCLPASYQTMNGYPAMITMTLGSCTGFTQVQQVTLTGMDATNPEQAEILSLLKGGVIF